MTALTIRRRSRSTASAPLLVRLVIWVLAAVVAVAGFTGLEGSTDSATGVDASTVFDASTGDVTGVYADHGGSQGELYAGLTGCDTRANYGDPTSSCGNPTPIELLPAWRWAGSLDLHTNINVGIRDAGNIGALMMSNLGAMAFAVASVIWSITLFLIRFAVTSDWLTPAGRAINSGFVHLSGALLGVVAVAWFVTLIRVGKLSLKANVPGMIRQIVTFAVPIAFMFYMSDQAAKDMDTSAGLETSFVESSTTIRAVGSPPWFAQKGTEYIDMIGSSFVHGFSLVNADGSSLGMTGTAPVDPSCQDYVDTLYTQYHRYAPAEAQSAALEQASRLWMLGMYDPWSVAQFGSNRDRHRVACFVLEENNDTPVKERQRLFALTYDWAGTGGHESIWADGPADELRFPGKGSKEYRNRVFSWMACYYDNGWRHDPRWIGIEGSDAQNPIHEIDDIDDPGSVVEAGNRDFRANSSPSPYCEARYNEGWASPTLVEPGPPVLGEVDANEVSDQTRKNGDGRSARNRINTFFGKSGGSNRIVLGVIAIVTAGMYLFALGAVSLGAIISQFGLILLLMLLPIAFVAWSMGAKAGSKMIRMTIGLCASKLIFTLILTAIVQITVLGMTLINSSGVEAAGTPQMAGFASTVATGLMPLIAFVALNKVMSSLGFGKLTSIGGALGMISNIAGQASKGGSVTDFAKGLDGKLSNRVRKAGREAGKRLDDHKDINRMKRRGEHLQKKLKGTAPGSDQRRRLEHQIEANEKALAKKRDVVDERKQNRRLAGGIGARVGTIAAATALAGPLGALGVAGTLAGKKILNKSKGRSEEKSREHWQELQHNSELERNAGEGPELSNTYNAGELTSGTAPDDAAAELARTATLIGHNSSGGRAQGAAHTIESELAACAASSVGNLSGEAITDTQRQTIKVRAAAELQVDPDDIIVDHFGNAVLDPARLSGAGLGSVPVALRGRPELWLDDAIIQGSANLPEADRATYVTGALVASGNMQATELGVVLSDVLADAGIQGASRVVEEYAQQLARLGSSEHAALMPTITLASGGLGEDLARGMRQVAERDMRELNEQTRRTLEEVRSSVESARAHIEDGVSKVSAMSADTIALAERYHQAQASATAGAPLVSAEELSNMRREFELAAAEIGAELRHSIPSKIQIDSITSSLQGTPPPEDVGASFDAALDRTLQELSASLEAVVDTPEQLRAFLERTMADLTGSVTQLDSAVTAAVSGQTPHGNTLRGRPQSAAEIFDAGTGNR